MNNDEPAGFPDGYFDDRTQYNVPRICIPIQVRNIFTERVKRSERALADRYGRRNQIALARIDEINEACSLIDYYHMYFGEKRVSLRMYKKALKLIMLCCEDRYPTLYRILHTTYIDMTYIPNHIIICIQ